MGLISRFSLVQFWSPILKLRLGSMGDSTLLVAVPKAAVNEDNLSSGLENEVGTPRK